ncbi:hypothetical protein N7465_010440 [Penicillium sp. CMV-2018d]|nr:hypothetical protein N7465_010440 [Penicillium sp. CMV-2018d]
MEYQIAPVFPRIKISCKRCAEEKATSIGAFLDPSAVVDDWASYTETSSSMSVTAATPRNGLVPEISAHLRGAHSNEG